jgi:hypothetical protein
MKMPEKIAVLMCTLCALYATPSRVNLSLAQQTNSDPVNLITADLVKPHIVKLAADENEGQDCG